VDPADAGRERGGLRHAVGRKLAFGFLALVLMKQGEGSLAAQHDISKNTRKAILLSDVGRKCLMSYIKSRRRAASERFDEMNFSPCKPLQILSCRPC
jgi:hypothetical protein